MTSIVAIVSAFMATFVLAFAYLSYDEQTVAAGMSDPPAEAIAELDR